MRTKTKKARAEMLASSFHPIAFPAMTSFADLFRDSREWKHGAEPNWPGLALTPGKRGGGRITSYCMVRGVDGNGPSLDAEPTAAVLEFCRREMLDVDHDSLHFQIIEHGNGCALVVVSYGQIIGSRWLAYIDASTMPKARESAAVRA